MHVQEERKVGILRVDIRPPSVLLPRRVDDGILDGQRRVVRVRQAALRSVVVPELARLGLATAVALVLARKDKRAARRAVPIVRPSAAILQSAVGAQDGLHRHRQVVGPGAAW